MKQYLLKVWMTAALSLLALGGVWGQVDYVSNFPVVSEIGESQISLEVQVDQEVSGLRSYYVLLESGETAPSLIEVFKGYPSGSYEDYPIKGNLNVSNTTNKQTAVISGLNPGTNYSLYVFTRHVEDGSIVIEDVNPTRIDFSTDSSPSPVQYVPNFPVVSEIGESQIKLEVQVDQAVLGLRSYYVLLESGETSPSLLEVSNGYSSATLEDYPIKGNLSLSNTTIKQTAVISGLNPGTYYSLYVFTRHVDGSIVIEDVNPTRIDFVMLESANPPYVVTDGYFPAPGTPEVSRDTKLRLTFNEKIAFGDPNALFLIHGDGSVRPLLSDSEEVSISVDSLELIIDLSNTPLTQYNTDYYVLIEPGFVKSEATGAAFEGIALVDPGTISYQAWYFKTETAPPFWKEGYPSITNQSIDAFEFNAWADQEGVFYGVVTLNSSPPTVEDIEQGLNGSARISFNETVNNITNPTSITVLFNSNTALGNTYFLHVVYKAGGKYSEVATHQVDRVVPEVLSSNPAKGTIVFPVTESIEILFSEEVVGIDGDSLDASHFSFELKDETIPVDFSISVVTESEMTKVVLTPTTALIEDTTYTITISKVYDLSGNPSDPVSITFETDGVSTWIGGNSSDWSDPLNWGEVDFVQYKSVVIKSGSPTYPVITTDTIDVHNLIIQPGAVLTHTGGTLNVTGLFHLQSSDVVNATYLNKGGVLFAVGDSIRVDQVIPYSDRTYHIASPSSNATQLSIGSTQGVYFFNNSTGAWESNLNNSLDPGVGYITRSSNDLQFRGDLNFTAFSHTVYRSTKGYGWNLIGNPYTAMLDFSQMITEDIEPTFWLWKNESGLYGTMNFESEVFVNLNSTLIPSNHAFFVKVRIGVESAQISFKPEYLTPNTTTYLKSGQVSNVDQVKLAAVSSSGVEDETALAFFSYASEGIDKYDSEKYLGGSANVLELFSLVGNNRLAINGMPLVETATIPLGYSTKTAGDYSIKVNTNTSESRLFLHDNVADVTEELLPGTAYSFNVASPGTNHSRFSLVVERVATGDFSEEVKSDVMKVMVNDRRLSVLVSPLLLDAEYYVIDMSGRILLNGKFNEEGLVDLGHLSVGSYVIQCNSRRSNLLERQKIVVY